MANMQTACICNL